jgi:hypothetical protein
VLPKTSTHLNLKVNEGEQLHEWDQHREAWREVGSVARSERDVVSHVKLKGGSYMVTRKDGSEKRFDVLAGTAPEKAPRPVTRAARYDLKPILFAPKITSDTAAKFDAAVTRFFVQLSERGPLVSRDAGMSVRGMRTAIQELEERLDGHFDRRVSRKDASLVAEYGYRYGSGQRVVAATVRVSAPEPGRKRMDVEWGRSSTYHVDWKQQKGGTNILDLTSGADRDRRMVETTKAGITTGESKYSSHDFRVTYAVDDQGEQIDKQHVH